MSPDHHQERDRARIRDQRFGSSPAASRALPPGLPPGSVTADYQPIVRRLEPVGFEALLRHVDAAGTAHSPTGLLSSAAARGRLAELDLLALELALDGAAGWLAGRLLFVNVAPLAPAALARHLPDVVALVERSAVPATDVVLEVHERQPGLRALTGSFDAVRRAGLQLALDDITTSRDCVAAARFVQPGWIKVDGSLVAGLDGGRTWRDLEQIIDCANSAGATLIAEQVETPRQAQVLRRMGVTHQQGHWPDRRPHTLIDLEDPGGLLRSMEDASAQPLGSAGLLGAVLQAEELQRRDRMSAALLRDHLQQRHRDLSSGGQGAGGPDTPL